MASVTNTPAHIFVKVNGAAAYLGTAEDAPRIEHRMPLEPVMNDVAGSRVPYDKMYVGQEAAISFTLTRWNEGVHADMVVHSSRFGIIPRGLDINISRGSLMMTQDLATELWIQYPFNVLASFNTLPAGYHYRTAIFEGPETLTPGVRPYRVQCVFSAIGFYQPESGSFLLYDHDMGGLPAIN